MAKKFFWIIWRLHHLNCIYWVSWSINTRKYHILHLFSFAEIDEPRKWKPRIREPFERLYGSRELERLLAEYSAARERIHFERLQPFSTKHFTAAARREQKSLLSELCSAKSDEEVAEESCKRQSKIRALVKGNFTCGGWKGEVVRARLPLVRCPVLVVQGGRDALVQPFHPEIIARELRHSRCENIRVYCIPVYTVVYIL